MKENPKIAIVYDWIDSWGGVERLLLTLHEMFPQAVFYTSYYDAEKASWAKDLNIKTSFIQKLPNFIKKSRKLSLFLYPYAFESFDLLEYDVVISVSSSFAKAVITRPETLHICYLLTPTRFLWSYPEHYVKSNFITRHILTAFREWDFIAAQRPDMIITLSHGVAARCKKYYQREADVIYPPFDEEYWKSIKPEKVEGFENKKYYLIVSRLEPYKKVDLAINVFKEKSDETLIVVGRGTQQDYLQSIASSNIIFLPDVSDNQLAYLYQHADALIMPQEEDFGYVALEAQFFGCPVIAYGRGGALETVVEGKTGVFFEKQTEELLRNGLATHHTMSYNGSHSLGKFSKKTFVEVIKKYVTRSM